MHFCRSVASERAYWFSFGAPRDDDADHRADQSDERDLEHGDVLALRQYGPRSLTLSFPAPPVVVGYSILSLALFRFCLPLNERTYVLA